MTQNNTVSPRKQPLWVIPGYNRILIQQQNCYKCIHILHSWLLLKFIIYIHA